MRRSEVLMQTGYGGDWEPRGGALRAEDAEAAKSAERRRAGRLPPIWIDRPRGSYRGALVLAVLAAACLPLLLYDLGVLWRPVPRETEGIVTFVSNPRQGDGSYYLNVAYEDRESFLRLTRSGAVPSTGDRVTVATHSRYNNRHILSVRAAGESGRVLYLEPAHVFGLFGAVGLFGLIAFAALALVQVRLARSHRRRDREWRAHNASS